LIVDCWAAERARGPRTELSGRVDQVRPGSLLAFTVVVLGWCIRTDCCEWNKIVRAGHSEGPVG
jgi:hypothetical protein